jgi:hypothetical protein
VQLANKANEPGKFTAFCSYEWTSMPNNMNLHRNIFFKSCAHVPAMPFTALDTHDPSDLWKWMDDHEAWAQYLAAQEIRLDVIQNLFRNSLVLRQAEKRAGHCGRQHIAEVAKPTDVCCSGRHQAGSLAGAPSGNHCELAYALAGLVLAIGELPKDCALVRGQRLSERREQEDAMRSPRITSEHMTKQRRVRQALA